MNKPIEPHGTIISGRWQGTRGAEIDRRPWSRSVLVRPFNDTAPTEDARIHLSPTAPIVIPQADWKRD